MSQLHDDTYSGLQKPYGRLVSVHIPCQGATIQQFLQLSLGQPRFYWESQRDSVVFAGAGTALELMAWGVDRFQTIERKARELFADAVVLNGHEPLASPRLFGGFAFRDDFVPDIAWSDFTPAHFVLPHYQLVCVDGNMWLSINAQIPYTEDPQTLLDDLTDALAIKADELNEFRPQQIPQQQHISLTYPMPYSKWETIIFDATRRMRAGELNKVVLSRVAEVRFEERIILDSAVSFLSETYPETYRFIFEPRPYHAFYGATPELLARVQGPHLQTMALAGSIRRGNTGAEDDRLAQELLGSPKDRYEHQLVTETIETNLRPITRSLQIGEPQIMQLSNIQHIHTPITGVLQTDSGVIPVVRALHPTPALGGQPRDIAMHLMGEYEPVPRGWYGAPIGWIDSNLDGQFAVAIRSAVAQQKRVWLYAGAGIVADSDPRKEWDEIGLKFSPMLNALGIFETHHLAGA